MALLKDDSVALQVDLMVAESGYRGLLVADSCRMEFPVGIFNTPNFFFQVDLLSITIMNYILYIYIYIIIYYTL